MAQKETYEKISSTVKLVAYVRTFTNIPFAKEMALESGAEECFRSLADESAGPVTQFIPIVEARYKMTDQIIAQHQITQVLEIAAGLSPRGLSMTENPDVVYVATDLSHILKQAKAVTEAILAKLNIARPNLYFRIVNTLDREDLLQAATPFQSGKPVAIITEGLLPYLSRAEKMLLAGNIHELLKKYGGIWITSDVNTKESFKNLSHTDEKIRSRMRQRIKNLSAATGRNMGDNIFLDETDMRQFFTKAGFTIEEYSNPAVFEDLSSVKRFDLNREKIREMLQAHKTLILKL